ncbi:hypothetical protein IQ265_09255 [Nodosilinea sp. LEGE 06152]|uniref:hypothetical protein n=1 Tax=Nodosilinea sp. LEGE 06152 TaxID=2777966 RepID=UPI001882B47E|nr:hypothetical protein [Nodosilinea sp. LEGE 06152]MBE9157010.1 hypothetical protein [Nodosilinea sp. LEGE 06152]
MTTRRSETVADRVTFDIEGLREAIESAHADNPLWERLPLAQKLRLLVEERLEEIQRTKTEKS